MKMQNCLPLTGNCHVYIKTGDECHFYLEFSSLSPVWVLESSSIEPLFSSKFEEDSRWHRGSIEVPKRQNHECTGYYFRVMINFGFSFPADMLRSMKIPQL